MKTIHRKVLWEWVTITCLQGDKFWLLCAHERSRKRSLESCPRAQTGMEPGGFACCLGSSAMGRELFLLAPAWWFELVCFFQVPNPAGGDTVVNVEGMGREVLHKMFPVRNIWFCGMNLPSIRKVLPVVFFLFHGVECWSRTSSNQYLVCTWML